MDSKINVIAFYLPQFHPTPHNNEWWGEGFTEWTNVAKAKKLYPGHYQPKIPADLGFYDLRLPEIREKQAELAKDAGVSGFCYYHYWFSEGNEELDYPFKAVVRTKKPDFPFCLCWANESWYSKFWNKDGVTHKTLLTEQKYLGEKDNEAHFNSLLEAFKDERYIKIDGKLLFLIYQPLQFEHFDEFKKQWNELAVKNGIKGFYFVGQTLKTSNIDKIIARGFDAVNHCHRLDDVMQYNRSMSLVRVGIYILKRLFKFPFVISYKKAIKRDVRPEDYHENVFPTMMPNWDHTPRSLDGGTVLHNANPQLFYQHAKHILSTVSEKADNHKIVFLKSWNEWGEGNYMEPDLRYGKGFINALRRALNEFE